MINAILIAKSQIKRENSMAVAELTKTEIKRANKGLVANHNRDRWHHWQAQSPNGPQLEPLALTHLRSLSLSLFNLISGSINIYINQDSEIPIPTFLYVHLYILR